MGLSLAARAKLNLFLAVRACRSDGYHEIETVFHSIDLADVVRVDGGEGLTVSIDPPLPVEGEEDLAARAARELAEDAGLEAGLAIEIEKRIPVAAGLGGGSADAAAVLVGANREWSLDWPTARLATVASAIGADVPFMIGGGAAVGRGRGDELEPVAPWPHLGVVLALPKRPLATAEVYAACCPDGGGVPVDGVAAAISARSIKALTELMRNDLTAAAVQAAPEIATALAAAKRAGVASSMSGSGPTVFGLSDDPERLSALEQAWGLDGFSVVRTTLSGYGVTSL